VEVRFRTAELRHAYTTQKRAVKLWGQVVARKYVQRIDALYATRSADDLFKIPPLRFHPLEGDKGGKYALTVHDRIRLILSFEDEALTRVVVEEVSKHYGD
jgi:proteic killer suppression protein